MTNHVTHLMDYTTTEKWCEAVRKPDANVPFPTLVFDRGNVLQFAIADDMWFTPDYDERGNVIQNDRLESFRIACLYDAMSNALDIGENLDDTMDDTMRWIDALTRHAGTGIPSDLEWLHPPYEVYSVVLRTLRD